VGAYVSVNLLLTRLTHELFLAVCLFSQPSKTLFLTVFAERAGTNLLVSQGLKQQHTFTGAWDGTGCTFNPRPADPNTTRCRLPFGNISFVSLVLVAEPFTRTLHVSLVLVAEPFTRTPQRAWLKSSTVVAGNNRESTSNLSISVLRTYRLRIFCPRAADMSGEEKWR
jgi:hypothetical protein